MRTVGIDASSTKTGIALFENGHYVAHTLIDKHSVKDSMQRVASMMISIKALLNQYQPNTVVMEECMMTNNISTVKLLSYIAGSVISWCTENNVEFSFMLPSEWRRIVGIQQNKKITRDMLKQEAVAMVKTKYGIEANDDICEAILIAQSKESLL